MTRRCDRCVHFNNLPWAPGRDRYVSTDDNRIIHVGTRAVGECRARPPERGYRGGVWHDPDRAYWPLVNGEEWCGAFTPAGEPENAR